MKIFIFFMIRLIICRQTLLKENFLDYLTSKYSDNKLHIILPSPFQKHHPEVLKKSVRETWKAIKESLTFKFGVSY